MSHLHCATSNFKPNPNSISSTNFFNKTQNFLDIGKQTNPTFPEAMSMHLYNTVEIGHEIYEAMKRQTRNHCW